MRKQKHPNHKNTVHIIHTSFVSVDDLTLLFKEFAPDIQVRHIVDDSLLPEVLAHGGVTSQVLNRICDYYKAAERAGAGLIFNQCSSVGEAASVAAQLVQVPVVKVDEPMARVACVTGSRIGVVATLETTLAPTCRLIETTAQKMNKQIEIHRCLVAGAFEILMNGNRRQHNRMVLDVIRRLAQTVDVVVCAQGSMAAILSDLGEISVPVLTSPKLGVEYAVKLFRRRKGAGIATAVAAGGARLPVLSVSDGGPCHTHEPVS